MSRWSRPRRARTTARTCSGSSGPRSATCCCAAPGHPFTRVEQTRASALLRLSAAIAVAAGDADAQGWVEPVKDGTVWIRLAHPEDAEAVGAMHRRCSDRTLYLRYVSSGDWHEIQMRRLSGGHSGATLVAVGDDGTVIGLGNVFPERPDDNEQRRDRRPRRGLPPGRGRRHRTAAPAAADRRADGVLRGGGRRPDRERGHDPHARADRPGLDHEDRGGHVHHARPTARTPVPSSAAAPDGGPEGPADATGRTAVRGLPALLREQLAAPRRHLVGGPPLVRRTRPGC